MMSQLKHLSGKTVAMGQRLADKSDYTNAILNTVGALHIIILQAAPERHIAFRHDYRALITHVKMTSVPFNRKFNIAFKHALEMAHHHDNPVFIRAFKVSQYLTGSATVPFRRVHP
jgi:hypothetical protein